MHTPIMFTPEQFITTILAVCGGITAIAGAIAVLAGWLNRLKAPNQLQDDRIKALEEKVKKHDELFSKDNGRLEHLENGNKIIQEALLALLAHGIDGNDIDSMKKAKTKLQQFLIDG